MGKWGGRSWSRLRPPCSRACAPSGRPPGQILQVLVRAVVEDLPDSQGQPAGALRPQLRELLGRVSSRHSGDAHVWQLYARLYGDGRSSHPQDDEKVSAPAQMCLFKGPVGRVWLLRMFPGGTLLRLRVPSDPTSDPSSPHPGLGAAVQSPSLRGSRRRLGDAAAALQGGDPASPSHR